MKRLVYLFVGLLFCVSVIAQEHLTFKGIPINGTPEKFCEQLVQKGFKNTNKYNDAYLYTGVFANKKCELVVFSSPSGKFVTTVYVAFEGQNSWYSLVSDFNKLKESLTQKYGKPDGDYHFFDSPYYEGDGYEMLALHSSSAHYIAKWVVDVGSILLTISAGDKYGEGYVSLIYEDKINKEGSEKEESAVVLDDL